MTIEPEWLDDPTDELRDREYPDPDDRDDDEPVDTIPCPECGEQVYEDAEQCVHCGYYLPHDLSRPTRAPSWWLAVAIAGAAFVLYLLMQTAR